MTKMTDPGPVEPKRTKVKPKEMVRWLEILVRETAKDLAQVSAERDRLIAIMAADEHGRAVVHEARKLIDWWLKLDPASMDDHSTHPLTPLRRAVEAYNQARGEPQRKEQE
jgi:hypothetical protein